MHVLLKILTGPHMGAESQLDQGEWTIGSDLDCDIILIDAGTMPKHALLRVGENTVFLLPQEGDIFFNNELLSPEGVKLTDFTAFSIGGTYMCIGPADRAWQSHEVPTLAFLGEQVQKSLVTSKNIVEEQEQKDKEPKDKEHVDKDHTEDKLSPSPHNHIQNTHEKKKTFWRIVTLVALLCVLTVLSIGIRQYFFENSATVIQNILKEYPNIHLVNIKTQDTLQGFVNNNKDMKEISELVQDFEQPIHLDIFTVEEVKKQLESIISKSNALWTIREVKHSLHISGYVQSQDTAIALINPLQKKMEQIKAKLNFITWDTLKKNLEQTISSDAFKKEIHFYPHALQVGYATVALKKEEEAMLSQIFEEVEDSFGIMSPFVHMSDIENPPNPSTVQNTLDICDTLTWTKQEDNLALQFGSKTYLHGHRLPSGWLIQELNEKYVVLTLEKQMRVCNAQIKENTN